MSDLKLFKLSSDHVTELAVSSMALEKSLQTLIEKHLDTFLGVTFLASEYSTGPKTGGRMDTLGIDENGAPVIIEYKKATNANVINQGLFHLEQADTELADRFAALRSMILEMGDDVEVKTLKLYFAFRRLKNFACVEVHTQTRKLLVYVKHPDPASVAEKGFARDVTNICHFGTGNVELTLTSKADVEKAGI